MCLPHNSNSLMIGAHSWRSSISCLLNPSMDQQPLSLIGGKFAKIIWFSEKKSHFDSRFSILHKFYFMRMISMVTLTRKSFFRESVAATLSPSRELLLFFNAQSMYDGFHISLARQRNDRKSIAHVCCLRSGVLNTLSHY